jgi:outer membrane protein TolC
MCLDQQFRPFSAIARAGALAAFLFASGLPLSASGQTPAPPPAPQQAPTTPISRVSQPASIVIEGSPLSMDEAVRLALENNLGIQGERLSPQIQSYGVARAKGAYAPVVFSSLSRGNNAAPPTDFLSSGVDVVTSGSFITTAGVQQNVRIGGGSYQLTFDGSRATTDAPRTIFTPQLGSHLNAVYNQPLLRGFKLDALRQQVLQSQNQLDIADIRLRQRVTQTSRNVRAAYYNLVGAIGGLEVAQQSLDLARQSLKNNRTRLEVGTMAPIDIVQSEAEVASNEESVIVAEAAIQSAQDQLRSLISNPSRPDFWAARYKPSDQPMLAPREIDLDAAVKNALTNRTDLLEFKKTMESTDIDRKFAESQKLPAIDLQARYGVTGIAGTQFLYGTPTIDGGAPPILGQSVRSFSDALHDVFGNNFRNWTVALQVSYPLGTSQADAALAQAKLQQQQQRNTLNDLEMQVVTQVREAARGVNTNLKRVEATRKARELSERRLEAEEKRFTVGLSSTFELVQAQRDLARARQNELNATIDYNRSLVDFETVQVSPIGGGGPR